MDAMSTGFKFVFESAGGGTTPENVAAQTGDWLSILLTALFLIVAAISFGYVFIKSKRTSNMRSTASHAAVKTKLQTKIIAVTVLAVLALAGAVASAVNSPSIKAFANANAAGAEYKDAITVTVHESDQSITFEDNFFKNTDANPIHIDHSLLTVSDEAKAILGQLDLKLTAKYSDGTTMVFDDGPSSTYKPFNQIELEQGQTQDLTYNSTLSYEVAKKLCDLQGDAFTLELDQAQCVTVTYSKGEGTTGEPPHSQTVSTSGQEGAMQLSTIAPGKGTLAKPGFAFTCWNTKSDGTGTPYYEGDTINPEDVALTLYPQWENTSGYTIKFTNDGKGIAKEKGKPAPTGDLTLTIPVETSYSINDAGEITFTKGGATLFIVETSANKYISYSKWERKGATVTEGTIEDEDPFKVSFDYDEFTITYRGVYENDPHGVMVPNAGPQTEETDWEETFAPANPENSSPVGVTAKEDLQKYYKKFIYCFVNWTDEDGNPVAPGTDPKKIVPTEPATGWKDATYIVHFAAPKAIYSENTQTGEKLMKFYYDEDPHTEALQGTFNDNYKFYVNNSKFEWDENGTITKIDVPTWYSPARIVGEDVTVLPTPQIYPTKVEFDSGFRNYKHLTSTDMWFMDNTAIKVLEEAGKNSNSAGQNVNPFGTPRQIKSIEGLENIYTENIESTAVMFGTGQTLVPILKPGLGAPLVTDPLESLDLSSWTNTPKLTGMMTAMFAGCNSLSDLKLPLNAESNFGELAYDTTAMFIGCAGLSSFTINNKFGENSKYMQRMFAACTSLLEFNLGTNATFGENAEASNQMFEGCNKLLNVDVSPMSIETNWYNIFSVCSALVKIELPSGLDQSSGYLGLTSDRQWYKYNTSTGAYESIPEGDIGQADGGTFTRLAPKAIYNAEKSTLTFYYDYETHNGEGQAFIINKILPTATSTVASLFPSWYDVEVSIDGNKIQYLKDLGNINNLKGKNVTTNIELKAPANTVIFDETFAKIRDKESDFKLDYIFGWFMADSNPAHANCLHTFKSISSKGVEQSNQFEYFPSEDATMWACPFGGYSSEIMCTLLSIMSKYDFKMTKTLQKDLQAIGFNGEEDLFYSGGDTYSGATTLDLSGLKLGSPSVFGLVANSPSLQKITLPSKNGVEGIFDWMFMNCSSLTTIEGGFMNEGAMWASGGIFKMFYGCSSLASIDLSNFIYAIKDTREKHLYTFKGCSKLSQLILGKIWVQQSGEYLNMEECSLPDGIWHNEEYNERDLSPADIPVYQGNTMEGLFYREEVKTGKQVTFTAGTGGTIEPASKTITIYGDTNFSCDGNNIYIENQVISAIPDANNAVKSWKLNDERVTVSGFADEVNTIDFNSADKFEFVVTFANENLKPKAVYDKNAKTLSFYYDEESHEADGVQVFEVYNNTHLNIDIDSKSVSAKLPAWYDYSISQNFDAAGSTPFIFNTSLKIDATKVIFKNSFANYDDLESISMWFMADHSGKQPFKEFYSEDAFGYLNKGFANINTTSIENVAYAFGGVSLLPSLTDSNQAKTNLFDSFEQNSGQIARISSLITGFSAYDTFGTSLTDIDISTFDQDHNISNYSGLFCNCRSLLSIELGSDIASAHITKMDAMFQNCENLGMDPGQTTFIKNLDKLNTNNVTSMNLLFFGDFGIKSLDLSNFNTQKTFYWTKTGAASWNTILMFWDCTRLSSIKITATGQESKTEPVIGWDAPLQKCFLLDNADPDDPEAQNVWTNKETSKKFESTAYIPYRMDWYPPKPDGVSTGTFERKSLNEYKTNFVSGDETMGKVNGEDSVTYAYIQNNTVRLDPENQNDMLSDNFRITPEPVSSDYKFSHWETGDGFEVEGKVVTPKDSWFFEADGQPENEHTLVAVFEEADKTAKAAYTKPTEANGTGSLVFYYDDDPHEEADHVFEVKTNTDVYNLPAWYSVSDIQPWDDDRPIPYFSDEIDCGADKPETIKVSFHKSFSGFKQLTSLSCWFMPAIDRSDKTKLYHPFVFDSTNFKDLDYINTENVYNLWYMFGGHENANDYSGSHTTSIDLSGFDQNGKLKNLDGMFANCADLEEVTLPGQFGINCTSMSHTFFNCRHLVEDNLAKTLKQMVTENVTDFSYMFASYKNNVDTTITDETTLTFPSSFSLRKAQTVEGMFAGYTQTKKLIITDNQPKVQTSIRPLKNYSYMFANNHSTSSALTSVDWSQLSWFNTANATNMEGMFMNNTSMTSLEFIGQNDPESVHFKTNSVDNMSYMFSGCSSLASIDPGRKVAGTFNTPQVTNMAHMFEKTAITSIDFKEGIFYYGSVKNTNRMFSGCSKLVTASIDRSKIPETISRIDSALYMFENCPLLVAPDLSYSGISNTEIPADETGEDTSQMVAPVYHMFANTDQNGVVSLNSTITEFTIAEDWINTMEQVGLETTSATGGTVLWYNKADYFVTGFIPASIPDKNYSVPTGADVTYGTFTNASPHDFSFTVNKPMWGSIDDQLEGMITQYQGTAILTAKQEEGVNVLYVKLDNLPVEVPYVAKPTESEFEKWQVFVDGSSEPQELSLNVPFPVSKNVEIQAVFKNGLETMYYIMPADESPTSDVMVGLGFANDDIIPEETRQQILDLGGRIGKMPDDGDFSKTEDKQAPWTLPVFASRVKEFEITKDFAMYEGFTSFNGWFKDLTNLERLQGIVYLNTKNVIDFTSMFEGCTNVQEIIFGVTRDPKKGNFVIMENDNSVKTTNMFKGCTNLNTLMFDGISDISEGTNMLDGCTNLNTIMLSDKLNKNLTNDLGLSESTWSYSGQKTLATFSSKDIQSNMKMAKDLGLGFDNYVIARVDSTSTIKTSNGEYGQITDNLKSGEYYDELTVGYNRDNGFMCNVIATDTALVATFVVKPQGETMTGYKISTQWSITINQKPTSSNYQFYDWMYQSKAIDNINPITLYPGRDITAEFDILRNFVSVWNSESTVLKFYYDEKNHETEGTVNPAPKQWYKESGGQSITPFGFAKETVTKVTFDDSVASYKSLVDTWCWFMGMTKLTSIEGLANLNITNVTNFDHMFEGCEELKSVDFSGNYGNQRVASFNFMFAKCVKLETLDISPLKTDGKGYESMLANCETLDTITFGDDWQNVTYAQMCNKQGKDFWVNEDEALSLDMSQFPNTEFADSGTFKVATKGADFVVPKEAAPYFNITQNSHIAFTDKLEAKYVVDSSTKNVVVRLSNTTAGITTEYPVLYRRINPEMKFLNWTLNGEAIIGEGTIKDKNTYELSAEKDLNKAVAWFESGTLHMAYDAEKHPEPVLIIPNEWKEEVSPFFKLCGGGLSGVRKIDIDESFKNYSDLVSLYSWFRDCSYLKEIEGLEYINTSQVTTTSYMFYGCCQNFAEKPEGGVKLNLSTWDTSKVTDMSYMFCSCNNVSEINFGNKFNTEKVELFDYMFTWCSDLKALDLTKFSIGTKTKHAPSLTWMTVALNSAETIDLSVKDCKYDYSMEQYSLAEDNLIECYKLKYIISNGKLRLRATDDRIGADWFNPNGEYWDKGSDYLTLSGTYAKAAKITFKQNSFYGGNYDNSNSIIFNAFADEYATAEVDSSDNSKIAIKLHSSDDTVYATYNKQFVIDTKTSYTFDHWTFNPKIPDDQKIVEDTQITANIKDTVTPKAYFNNGTLTFYYDENVHEGTAYNVPLVWGCEEYSANYNEEQNKSPFEACANATTAVVINESFAGVQGLCSMCCWFKDFVNVQKYTGLENIDVSSLGRANIGFTKTFFSNKSLESIDISSFNTIGEKGKGSKPRVNCYDFMFTNCIKLKNITFYDEKAGHTNFVLNDSMCGMFGNCRSLEKLDFSGLQAFSSYNSRNMFKNCYNLEELNLGQMIYSDDFYAQNMIDSCYSLKKLIFNNPELSWYKIYFAALTPAWGDWLFNGKMLKDYWGQPVIPGEFTRLLDDDSQYTTIDLAKNKESASDGIVYFDTWSNWQDEDSVKDEDGHITHLIAPKGAQYSAPSDNPESFRLFHKVKSGNYDTSYYLNIKSKDAQYKRVYFMLKGGESKIVEPLTIEYYVGAESLMQSAPSANANANNPVDPSIDPQVDPQVDPVDPQVDPVVPEPEDAAGAAAALMAAAPALAFFGMRKRLRGKHAKIK